MTTINIGTTPNDGNGDTLRSAFNIVNDNFTEVEGFLVSQVTQIQLEDALSDYVTITNHDADINALNGDISALDSRLTNDEIDIAALQTDQGNLTIALGNKASLSQLNSAISDVNDSIASTNTALSNKIDEAPIDGFAYVRMDGAWVKLVDLL